MGLLGKSKSKPQPVDGKEHKKNTSDPSSSFLQDGRGDLWDILCPDGIDVSNPDRGYIVDSLGGKRPMVPLYVTRGGWPRKLSTDWLSSFINLGEVDLTIYNEKLLSRHAVHHLTKSMTMLKSNYRAELKRGSIDQLHDLETKIRDTDALIEDISLGENDLFHTSVLACLFADNDEQLDQMGAFLEDELGGSFIHVRRAFERIKDGFLSVLPRGKNEMADTYRNLDRRALSTLFPFASSELRFKGGIPFAVNQSSGNLVFLNLFAEDNNNYNAVCFGESGSGKSFAISTLIARSMLGVKSGGGCHAVILDPENEYRRLTKALNGVYLRLGTETPIIINPCAISVTELEMDEDDDELRIIEDGREFIMKDGKEYVRFVPIKEKANEIISFFDILVQGNHGDGLDAFEEGYLQQAIQEVFEERGITPNPHSLFEEMVTERNGEIYHDLVPKPEITLTDIYERLTMHFAYEVKAERLLAAIKPWLRGGFRGLFDGETYFGEGVSTNLDDAKLITFDISELEEGSMLRKLCYFVCLTFTWQKFVKSEKNATKEKIVVADEFWQMVDTPALVDFSERLGRRCRKRNTSFIIASQDAKRILENPKAYGVVTNSSTQLILRQNSVNLKIMKEAFDMSEGELSIVMGKPKKGEGILRTRNESAWIRTDPFEYERILFESNQAKRKELEREHQARQDQSLARYISTPIPSLSDEE